MTAQVFTPTPRHYDYNRERDLETVYVLGKGLQDRLQGLLTVTAEEREHQKNLVISKLSSGGLYVNEIQVG